MNYRKLYMRIISHAKLEQKQGLRPSSYWTKYKFSNQCFEFHHILPKSLFPNWVKRKSNIVPLTPREHYVCHLILQKIYSGREMVFAFWSICNCNKLIKINSHIYEKAKVNMINCKKGKGTWNGKHHTEESKLKISNSKKGSIPWNKGISRTEEFKNKLKIPHPWSNGDNNPSKRLDVRKKISESKMGSNNPRAIHWIIKNIETDEIFEFYGGFKRWAKEHSVNASSLRKNKNPKYKVILSEKIS